MNDTLPAMLKPEENWNISVLRWETITKLENQFYVLTPDFDCGGYDNAQI
jgi:hypothetical protein